MSDMGKAVVKKIGDREIVCRELTVSGVRKLLVAAPPVDVVDAALFTDIRLGDLQLMTDLASDDIEAMFPSELAQVVEGCRAVNPDFFAMLGRLSNRV